MKRNILFIFLFAFITIYIVGCTSAPNNSEEVSGEEIVYEESLYEEDSSVVADTVSAEEAYEIEPIVEAVAEEEHVAEAEMEVVVEPDNSLAEGLESSEEEDNIPVRETEGTIAYYCPQRMLENSHNNVSVTLTPDAVQQAIQNLKNRVTIATGDDLESIEDGFQSSDIILSNKMKVELAFDEEDFKTMHPPQNLIQVFDGENDMNWDWIIRPLKIGKLNLSIIVSAYNEKTNSWVSVKSPPKIFDVKVKVDPQSYISKLWFFLGDHPEWIFIQVIFPLIAFFYGLRKGKKTKNT